MGAELDVGPLAVGVGGGRLAEHPGQPLALRPVHQEALGPGEDVLAAGDRHRHRLAAVGDRVAGRRQAHPLVAEQLARRRSRRRRRRSAHRPAGPPPRPRRRPTARRRCARRPLRSPRSARYPHSGPRNLNVASICLYSATRPPSSTWESTRFVIGRFPVRTRRGALRPWTRRIASTVAGSRAYITSPVSLA